MEYSSSFTCHLSLPKSRQEKPVCSLDNAFVEALRAQTRDAVPAAMRIHGQPSNLHARRPIEAVANFGSRVANASPKSLYTDSNVPVFCLATGTIEKSSAGEMVLRATRPARMSDRNDGVPMTTLLLVGATGVVGRSALQAALADARIERIVAPTRRPLDRHPKLHNPLVDFDRLPVAADWWQVTSVVCAFGTTQAKAGSAEAFRKVDHDYPLQVAQITRRAQCFALCSSTGADANSRFIYLRTKGELEDDLCKLGFPSVTILRPGFLEGERSDRRPLEIVAGELLRRLRPIIPRRFRLSPATVVARLLIEGAVAKLPGRHIVEAGEIADQ